VWGTGTPKDKDEVRLILKTAFARILPIFDLSWAENAARRKWTWIGGEEKEKKRKKN
jgi:hypothetical protein